MRPATWVAGEEDAAVADLDEPVGSRQDLHRLALEVGADVVVEAVEADAPALAHAPPDQLALASDVVAVGLGVDHVSVGLLGHRLLRSGGQLEALDRRYHADALVGTLDVVALDPGIELGLRLLDGGDEAPGEELGAQRLVEAFHLARGRRAVGSGEQVAHPVSATEAVEEHLALVRSEARARQWSIVLGPQRGWARRISAPRPSAACGAGSAPDAGRRRRGRRCRCARTFAEER